MSDDTVVVVVETAAPVVAAVAPASPVTAVVEETQAIAVMLPEPVLPTSVVDAKDATADYIPVADGSNGYTWQAGGGGGGGSVDSVTAADDTITVGGTGANPTVKVTADTFDAYGAAAAAQSNAESYADSAVAVETSRAETAEAALIPLPSSPSANQGLVWNGSAWVAETLTVSQISGALAAANNLDDVDSPSTALANLGGIPLADVTTTGDLLVASGNAAVARLGVGSDGQVLTADSTQTVGAKWATPSGGGGAPVGLPLYTPPSGGFVSLPYNTGEGSSPGTLLLTNGQIWYLPLVIMNSPTVSALSAQVTTAGSSGALLRFGIFNDSNGQPGTVLLDAGTVAATSSSTTVSVTGLSQQLTPGRYWVGVVAQGAPVTAPTIRVIAGTGPIATVPPDTLSHALTGGFVYGGYSQTGVTGALGTAASLTVTPIGSGNPLALIAVSF